ncbi:hypothetical protein [Chryseobacterium sp. 3008163]|uniref:hypothetical protein n=1 Tax=Chryseobacterium sp. 3008163 TaxID=2478663 RepID=UPI000F0C2C33|nr:hypothetical protein [Chryseobacterium sp. 3008163]AYN00245.1 hypothetical protein EAG08_07825 [Chryseobacterium sp. 3008163]
MNWGLIKYTETISFDYINEIFYSVQRNIILSASNNYQESFNELLDFTLSSLVSKSFGKSEASFSKSATFLINIYSNLPQQYKEIFVERSVSRLSHMITIANYSEEIKNEYASLSYLSLINILKVALEEDNHTVFNIISKSIGDDLQNLNFDQNNSAEDLLFNFNVTLLSWMYYLRFSNVIDYSKYDVRYLEAYFDELYFNSNDSFISRFYKLYDEIDKGLWAINEWEINKPPTDQAYFTLMTSQWLPFGLLIILLKYDGLISTNNDYSDIPLNPRFKYQLNNIKENLDIINNNKDITRFLSEQNFDEKELNNELNYRKEKIIELFTF